MGSRWREGSESWGKMSTVVRPNYGTKGTDNITDLAELEGLLSPFQVEKLTYFFNQFFDFNEDGKIDAADFAGLNERLRKVAGRGEELGRGSRPQQGGRRLCLPLLVASHVGQDVQG